MFHRASFAAALLAASPAFANEFTTDFEFDDQSLDFTLGASPLTARFVNGRVQANNAGLHLSGFRSWMVLSGPIGEITFHVPAERVELFFKDETVSVNSVLTGFAPDGSVLGIFRGSELNWTQVTLGSADQPVARLTLENNFFGGAAPATVIDDLTYCAMPLVGTSYCGPAAPNSSGLPGVITARGSTTATSNSLMLVAEQLPPNSFGYFLNSQTQGFIQPPGSQGNLCLGGSIGRHAEHVANTGAAGELILDLDLTALPRPNGTHSVVAGETWNFQCWFRDTVGGPTSNFTDGISIVFQ